MIAPSHIPTGGPKKAQQSGLATSSPLKVQFRALPSIGMMMVLGEDAVYLNHGVSFIKTPKDSGYLSPELMAILQTKVLHVLSISIL